MIKWKPRIAYPLKMWHISKRTAGLSDAGVTEIKKVPINIPLPVTLPDKTKREIRPNA